MAQNYNAYEVFEIAQQIEKSGSRFYRQAAETIDEQSSKRFLNELADMEDAHERYFQALMQQYNLNECTDFIDLEGQSASYLHAVADGYVKSNLQKTFVFPESCTMLDVLKMAIEFEKSTVVYFSALKASINDEAEKEKIESLILEELSHISILTEKMREIDNS